MNPINAEYNFCNSGLGVIETEGAAVLNLTQAIGENFDKACQLLYQCKGRIIVTGIGKSGHIGNKIAATLASTGSPAFFMHPAEASHGDLGMVTGDDTVLILSNSGTTIEILDLIPQFKRLNVPLITLTGNPESTLASMATVNLNIHASEEACPLNLAPTTSTTLALVMGDAIAIALLKARGFTADDFVRSHPGGKLGKTCFLTVGEICRDQDKLPVVHEHIPIREALTVINTYQLGMTSVVSEAGVLIGIYTDGDIRRTLSSDIDIITTPISQVMSKNCKTITKSALAQEALALMQQHKITVLLIVDEHNKPNGLIHIHDLLKAGVI